MLAQEPGCAAVAAAKARAERVRHPRGPGTARRGVEDQGVPTRRPRRRICAGGSRRVMPTAPAARRSRSTDVDAAVASLNAAGETLAAYVLQAAVAAAQSERESMSLLLEQAVAARSRLGCRRDCRAHRSSPRTKRPAICGCRSIATRTRVAPTCARRCASADAARDARPGPDGAVRLKDAAGGVPAVPSARRRRGRAGSGSAGDRRGSRVPARVRLLPRRRGTGR